VTNLTVGQLAEPGEPEPEPEAAGLGTELDVDDEAAAHLAAMTPEPGAELAAEPEPEDQAADAATDPGPVPEPGADEPGEDAATWAARVQLAEPELEVLGSDWAARAAAAAELPGGFAAQDAAAAFHGLVMYDAGIPPQPHPRTDAVLIYAGGGEALHVWTDAEIAEQTARFFLPCWVATGTGAAAGAAEAAKFLLWLTAHRAPRGCLVVLDLETRGAPADLAYEAAFRSVTSRGGHWLMLYGSAGNLFSYPLTGGGYFVADPPEQGTPARPHMYAHRGVTATQWRWSAPGQPWDLSLLAESLIPHLWDRQWLTALLAEAQHMQASMSAIVARLGDYARVG
jgi:hypothetical protein